jgi:hypothetical protein
VEPMETEMNNESSEEDFRPVKSKKHKRREKERLVEAQAVEVSEDEYVPESCWERFVLFMEYLWSTPLDNIKVDFNIWLDSLDLYISHASSFKENWDFLIMFTACWNVFVLPISIAFQTSSETVDLINTFVDMCFVMDILIVFRTTILDEESGEEIKNANKIAKMYIHGRFTIDFLSTVPFDTIALMFMDEVSAKQF